MTERGWYLSRAIPWVALLGCSAAAAAVAGLLDRWPSTALGLLPVLVACCAAGAAFLFDETALPVVEVTPRGALWRRTARLATSALPLCTWTVAIWWRPGDLPLDRSSWLLLGAAAIAVTAGAAGLASRHGITTPGAALAGVVVLAAVSPIVVTSFLGLDSVYPVGGFPAGVRTFWLVLGAVGLLACVGALRRRPVG